MQAPEQTVAITSVDHFALLVARWHANRVNQLKQSMAVPDEVEVAFDLTGEGEDTALTPEQREGFKVGLTLALSLFGELPFTVTAEPAVPESEGPAPETPAHD